MLAGAKFGRSCMHRAKRKSLMSMTPHRIVRYSTPPNPVLYACIPIQGNLPPGRRYLLPYTHTSPYIIYNFPHPRLSTTRYLPYPRYSNPTPCWQRRPVMISPRCPRCPRTHPSQREYSTTPLLTVIYVL